MGESAPRFSRRDALLFAGASVVEVLLGKADYAEAQVVLPEMSISKRPEDIQRISKPTRGAGKVFWEQIERDQPITFGAAELHVVEQDWTEFYNNGPGKADVDTALLRINRSIDDNPENPTYLEVIQEFFAGNVPEKYLYIAFAESWFDENAESPVGALGAYQIMKSTAIKYGMQVASENGEGSDDRLDPVASARFCATYLEELANIFLPKIRQGSEVARREEALQLAVYAYNGSFAETYGKRSRTVSLVGFHTYAQDRMRQRLNEHIYRVEKDDTLGKIARRSGRSAVLIKDENPGVQNWNVLSQGALITIPSIDEVGPRHLVEDGDTIETIAARWHVTTSQIFEVNETLREAEPLATGSLVAIPIDSPIYQMEVKNLKSRVLSGFVENINYRARFNAIVKAVGVK